MKHLRKQILKLNGFIPDVLRYNHSIRSLMFWISVYINKLKIADEHDSSINEMYVSLTVGIPFKLRISLQHIASWKSNNLNVEVSQEGVFYANKDALGNDSQAIVSAYDRNGVCISNYYVTIVNWMANQSSLEITGRLPNYHVLAYKDGAVYFCVGRSLFITKDGFRTRKRITFLPVLPANGYPMLITPYGFFFIGEKKVLHSADFGEWKIVHTLQMHGSVNMFDYHVDKLRNICYVFVGEYSCNPDSNHRVYRGVVQADYTQVWDVILDFDSINTYRKKKSMLSSARHIHIVRIDPYTGYLWVGTGDEDVHAKIMFSSDYGDTFRILGTGSQEWRTLSIWFTENYIYWNMDSHEPEKIFRIHRKELPHKDIICTPHLSGGATTIGVRYLVEKTASNNRFPVGQGSAYDETEERKLDSDNTVIALNDVRFDSREIVAELSNGAQFLYCWAKSAAGDDIVIMGASPEGNLRDMQGRVFGIKENHDGTTIVQELISVRPKNIDADYKTNMFTQLIPLFQDRNGDIYFKSRNLSWPGIYKTRLIWADANITNKKMDYKTRRKSVKNDNYNVRRNPRQGFRYCAGN